MQISRNENLNSNFKKLKHKKRKRCTVRERERGAKGTNSLARSLSRCSLKELENSARENDGEEERRGHLLCRKAAGHDKGRY
jgi:hypothetical protein